jgi:hypothetical protein
MHGIIIAQPGLMKNSIRRALLTTLTLTATLSAAQALADCPDPSKPCPLVIRSQGIDVGAAITQGSPGAVAGVAATKFEMGGGDHSLYHSTQAEMQTALGSRSLLNATARASIGGRTSLEGDMAIGAGLGARAFLSTASRQPQTEGALVGGEVAMISPRAIGDLSTVLTLSLAGGKGTIGDKLSSVTEGGMHLTVATPRKFSFQADATTRNFSATGQQELVTDVATFYSLSSGKSAFVKLFQRDFSHGDAPSVRSLQGGMRLTLPHPQAGGAN